MSDLFYQFITAPFSFFKLNAKFITPKFAFSCLLLSGMGLASTWTTHSLPGFLLSGVVLSFFLAGLFVIQAMVLDFISQTQHRSGHSLTLFYGLCVSHLPALLLVPITLVISLLPSELSFILSLSKGALTLFVITLQIRLLRSLYNFKLSQGLFVFFFPYILIGLSVAAILFFSVFVAFIGV